MATSGQWRAQRSGFLSKKDGTAPRRLELLARGTAGSQPMPRGRVFLARRSASRQPRHSLQTMTFTALLARLPRHCPAPLNRGFAHETEGLREVAGVQGNELRELAELEPRKVACRRAARHSGRRRILGALRPGVCRRHRQIPESHGGAEYRERCCVRLVLALEPPNQTG